MEKKTQEINMYSLSMDYNPRKYADLEYYAPTCKIVPSQIQLSFFDSNTGMFTEEIYFQTVVQCDHFFQQLSEIILCISEHKHELADWKKFETALRLEDAEKCQQKNNEEIIEFLRNDSRFEQYFENREHFCKTSGLGAKLFEYIDEQMTAFKQALQERQEEEKQEIEEYMSKNEVLALLETECNAMEEKLKSASLEVFYEEQKQICLRKKIIEDLKKQ